MCNKRNSVNIRIQNKSVRVDSCLKETIKILNKHFNTVACCCGHERYPITILARRQDGQIYDICSGVIISRIRRYYRKDADGFYYIPEVCSEYKP